MTHTDLSLSLDPPEEFSVLLSFNVRVEFTTSGPHSPPSSGRIFDISFLLEREVGDSHLTCRLYLSRWMLYRKFVSVLLFHRSIKRTLSLLSTQRDVINLSDIEFQPTASIRSGRNVGQASNQEIIEGAARDRFSSKRMIKQLEFGNGAASTRMSQELWVGRFSAFRTATLMQSLDQPFTGADLIRFFEPVIGKLELVIGEPAPNIDCVQSGVRVLSAYGTFS